MTPLLWPAARSRSIATSGTVLNIRRTTWNRPTDCSAHVGIAIDQGPMARTLGVPVPARKITIGRRPLLPQRRWVRDEAWERGMTPEIAPFDCEHPGPADVACSLCGLGPEDWDGVATDYSNLASREFDEKYPDWQNNAEFIGQLRKVFDAEDELRQVRW